MNYCTSCGTQLSVGVNFCKHCGAEVSDTSDWAKGMMLESESYDDQNDESFVAADEEYAEIIDYDDKGLDLTRAYYMTIDGHRATMRMDDGRLIRQFTMRTNVIQATTSGEYVTIITEDGYTHLYTWEGRLVRRTRN